MGCLRPAGALDPASEPGMHRSALRSSVALGKLLDFLSPLVTHLVTHLTKEVIMPALSACWVPRRVMLDVNGSTQGHARWSRAAEMQGVMTGGKSFLP